VLGPWIALICVILGALGFAGGIVNASAPMIVIGILLLIAAGIGGAKGSFVHHHDGGEAHH
jgi:hypothetical protein